MCGQLNFLKNVGLPLGATETPPVILKLTRASTETFTFYILSALKAWDVWSPGI